LSVPADRISACLIVQDEQERLPAALASLSFCDELVVVDGGSRDRTVEFAREAGASVIESPWPGYAIQRNVALDAATGDWVLEIDADERISPRLRASIEALLTDPPAMDVAIFALRNEFLGGPLGPSAKYPTYRARLFRRGAYRHDEARAVHEGIELRERPAILDGDLEHILAASLREALVDAWRYARLESAHVPPPGSPLGYLKGIVLRPAVKFAYRMIVDGGWRDGWRGALKISLDAGSDALVWALVLAGRGAHAGASGPADAHFGRRYVGPAKVVAVASGAGAQQAALSRLADLRARGADVALISDQPSGTAGVPSQTVSHLGPLPLIRALEAELQVRPIDAVIAFGRRAELVLRLVPADFRPESADLEGEVARRASG
jgi:glycosyltransferase involved in cell wall biosynthesis